MCDQNPYLREVRDIKTIHGRRGGRVEFRGPLRCFGQTALPQCQFRLQGLRLLQQHGVAGLECHRYGLLSQAVGLGIVPLRLTDGDQRVDAVNVVVQI